MAIIYPYAGHSCIIYFTLFNLKLPRDRTTVLILNCYFSSFPCLLRYIWQPSHPVYIRAQVLRHDIQSTTRVGWGYSLSLLSSPFSLSLSLSLFFVLYPLKIIDNVVSVPSPISWPDPDSLLCNLNRLGDPSF